jgi:hypothetical protein
VVGTDERLMRHLIVVLALCGCSKAADDYMKKSKQTEAKLMLNKIVKSAKVHAIQYGKLPVGKVGPSPAEDCCKAPGAKCAVDPNAWGDPIWKALEFEMVEQHNYRYTFESNGTSFTATAIGNLDCDNDFVTYTATGLITKDGGVEASITDTPTGRE